MSIGNISIVLFNSQLAAPNGLNGWNHWLCTSRLFARLEVPLQQDGGLEGSKIS